MAGAERGRACAVTGIYIGAGSVIEVGFTHRSAQSSGRAHQGFGLFGFGQIGLVLRLRRLVRGVVALGGFVKLDQTLGLGGACQNSRQGKSQGQDAQFHGEFFQNSV